MRLEGRKWKVSLADFSFDGLDCDFSIEKSLQPEPNSCSLTVFNLSERHRKQLEELNLYDPRKGSRAPGGGAQSAKTIRAGRIRTTIEAGYEEGTSLLFQGDLRLAVSSKSGGDWVTRIEGEDGGRSVLAARVSHSFPPGTPLVAVVRTCATAMGLGVGNLQEVLPQLASTVFTTGTVLDGAAASELKRVLRRHRVTYSVQNGGLQFLVVGKGRKDSLISVPVLSYSTGLIGSPKRDATGEIEVQSLLIPGIAPGNYVTLATQQYAGLYRVEAVKHEGSTSGQAWYHVMHLRAAK